MPVSSKFYSIFWNNLQSQNVFLLHKEQLLQKSEMKFKTANKFFYYPRIVLSNSLSRKESSQRIEQRIQNRNIETDHALNSIGTRNINEEKIVKFLTEKFAKPIDIITKKLKGSNVSQIKFATEIIFALSSEEKLIALLRKYDIVPSNVSTWEDLKKYGEDFFDKEVTSILNPDHFLDILESVDNIANYYNDHIFNSLIEANKFYTDILYDKENFKDRIDLFDGLYEAKSLIGGHYKTYYECMNCAVGTFSGNVTLDVMPSKVKLKCPNCGKDVFYLAPYKITESIFKDITSKDGLIHQAVKYLLESHKILNKTNVTAAGDVEMDFEILNKENKIVHVVETKMFKTDRTDEVIIANIREGLRKLLTARQKLIDKVNPNYIHVGFHYLTNITDEVLIREVYDEFRTEIGNSRVAIHNVNSFKNFAEELSHAYKL